MSEQERPNERDLFDALIDLVPEERIRRLDALPADAVELRRRVEALLEGFDATERAGGFLDDRVMRDLRISEAESDGPLPRMLGAYRLLRVLGMGGMGIVFEAEENEPRRKVAVKILRDDTLSREAMRRFRREVDTLGRLQHRGIAQIYGAGRAMDGDRAGGPVSYIAMELLDGVALDEYVRSERASPREIASLLADVADAVHHAHERGVIHRDLKPANIMVVRSEGTPQPKILDFGVARLIGGEGTGDKTTTVTSHGLIVGTVAYMSPEQLSGDPAGIDARTDVYALGAILYELLAGRLPLDVRNRPIADAARIVHDEEPSRLSHIDRRYRGDLETIVATALEKDRDRRYPSAAALGDELRRYCADEPIIARPPSGTERVARFARRHRSIVAGAMATLAVLLIGIAATTTLALREIRARRAADWTAYRSHIGAASAALAAQDAEGARRHLAVAAPALRGWEWRALAANLDQSFATVRLAEHVTPQSLEGLRSSAIWPYVDRVAAALPSNWPSACRVPSVPDGAAPAEGAILAWHDQDRSAEFWLVKRPGEQDGLIVRLRGADGSVQRDARLAIDAPTTMIPASMAINRDRDRVGVVLRDGGGPARVCVLRLDGGPSASMKVGNSRHGELPIAMGAGGLVALGGGPERTAILWDADSGRTTPLAGHIGDMRSITFSHDGRRIATGGNDRAIRIFEIDDAGAVRQTDVERQHQDAVLGLHFAPDDATLLSSSVDGTIRLWSTPRDRPGMMLIATLAGHRASLASAEFSHDGGWIASVGVDGTLRAWPADPAALTGTFAVPDNASGIIDFARDGSRFVAENTWGRVRSFDDIDGIPKESILVDPGYAAERGCRDLAISPDGSRLATIESDFVAHLYALDASGAHEGAPILMKLSAIGFSDDGRPLGLLLGEGPEIARLCWLPGGEPLALPLPRCASPHIESTADGSRLRVRDVWPRTAGGGEDQHVVLLDARTGESLRRFTSGWANPADFGQSLDGRLLLAVVEEEAEKPDTGRVILICDAESGATIHRVEGHADRVFSVTFSPDGTRLVSGGRDRLLRVWDTATWDEVVSLAGAPAYIWSLRFSPDGRRLGISGGDRTYRLWKTRDELP